MHIIDVWWGILMLLTSGLALLTLVSFVPGIWRWFDIAGHYRVHYLAFLALLGGIFWVGAEWLWGGIAILFGLVNFGVTYPYIFRSKAHKIHQLEAPAYRLLVVNVLRRNKGFAQLVRLVETSQPDFIALIEPDQDWLDGLEAIRSDYPYVHSALRDDNYGLALLSRLPLFDLHVDYLIEKEFPTISAQVELPVSALTITVTHPPPPKSRAELKMRNAQLTQLGRTVAVQPDPKILCGDFNCTPWVSTFTRMAKTAKLRSSSRGFGFQPTWPSDRWLIAVPIDHALVSKQIEVVGHGIGPPIGSDHLPVFTDFIISKTDR
jgi:endonuclease/exonuclease/phosphatase (EEP) superfamily protein YafD